MNHREALDCPCGLETRIAVGGGRVQVHRDLEFLRDLSEKVRALPKEGRRHVGYFVERAAVLALLERRGPNGAG